MCFLLHGLGLQRAQETKPTWRQGTETKSTRLYTMLCVGSVWALAPCVTWFCSAAPQSCSFCAPSLCRTQNRCRVAEMGPSPSLETGMSSQQ